jgi:hypothetical protein
MIVEYSSRSVIFYCSLALIQKNIITICAPEDMMFVFATLWPFIIIEIAEFLKSI